MSTIIDKKTLGHVWPIRNKRILLLSDATALKQETNDALKPLGTIRRILAAKGKVILALSFGTFTGHPLSLSAVHRADALAKFPAELSSKSLVSVLRTHFADVDITFVPDSMAATDAVSKMTPGSIVVLENLRFYANELSSKVDARRDMAKVLASYCDVFVNDSFESLQGESASATELARLVRHAAAGQLLESEITYFQKYLTSQLPSPTCLVVGTNRVEEKLKSLEKVLPRVHKVLFGTAIALPFLKARGINVGKVEDPVAAAWTDRSVTLEGYVQRILSLAQRYRVKLVFPVDFVCGEKLEMDRHPHVTQSANVPDQLIALDLGPNTQALYATELRDSRVVFWNGHLGAQDSHADLSRATCAIGKALVSGTGDVVVCGRSTLTAFRATNLESSTSHVASAPSAAMAILSGAALPGLEVISDATPALTAGTEKIQELLRHTALFAECAPREIQALASRAVLRSLARGDVLLREGDRVTSVFIVSSGQLSAVKKRRVGDAPRILGRGQTVGELDFLHGRAASEEIIAASNDVSVYHLTAASVNEVLIENNEMTAHLVKGMIDRVRSIEESERTSQHNMWSVVDHDSSLMRKPIPTPAFSKTFTARGVHALSGLISAAVLHTLTRQLSPFKLEEGTCVLARPAEGLGMVLLHHFARDVSFSNLLRAHTCGPVLGAILSNAALAPLRLASQGVPFAKMTSATLADVALTDGAMALAPRVAHSLFRFAESPNDRTSRFAEVLLTAICRAVTAVIFFPIIARRTGSALIAKNLLVYVCRQVASLLIELFVHRYLQAAGKYFAF